MQHDLLDATRYVQVSWGCDRVENRGGARGSRRSKMGLGRRLGTAAGGRQMRAIPTVKAGMNATTR